MKEAIIGMSNSIRAAGWMKVLFGSDEPLKARAPLNKWGRTMCFVRSEAPLPAPRPKNVDAIHLHSHIPSSSNHNRFQSRIKMHNSVILILNVFVNSIEIGHLHKRNEKKKRKQSVSKFDARFVSRRYWGVKAQQKQNAWRQSNWWMTFAQKIPENSSETESNGQNDQNFTKRKWRKEQIEADSRKGRMPNRKQSIERPTKNLCKIDCFSLWTSRIDHNKCQTTAFCACVMVVTRESTAISPHTRDAHIKAHTANQRKIKKKKRLSKQTAIYFRLFCWLVFGRRRWLSMFVVVGVAIRVIVLLSIHSYAFESENHQSNLQFTQHARPQAQERTPISNQLHQFDCFDFFWWSVPVSFVIEINSSPFQLANCTRISIFEPFPQKHTQTPCPFTLWRAAVGRFHFILRLVFGSELLDVFC